MEIVERENHLLLLQKFKSLVQSKTVRFWDDIKDIKLAIPETLNQYARREELIGWIPGDQGVNGAELAEEIARLTKENAFSREKVAQYEAISNKINGKSMMEFIQILESEKIRKEDFKGLYEGYVKAIKNAAGEEDLNLFHVLCGLSEIIDGISKIPLSPCVKNLLLFGIIKISSSKPSFISQFEFTDDGRNLFIYLKQNHLTQPIKPPSIGRHERTLHIY